MSSEVVVRVVPVRPDRRLAWAVSLLFGLLTLAVIFYVIEPHRLFHVSKYTGLGVVMSGWALGTLLGFRARRPFVTRARIEPGGIRLGRRRLPKSSVDEVRAVRAAHGYSVAIAGPDVFLEVEREQEARRLVSALGGAWPGSSCAMRLLPDWGRQLQRGLGATALVASLGYALVAGVLGISDAKAYFGLPAIICGIASSVVFLLRPFLARPSELSTALVKGPGAAAKHFELHRAPQTRHDASPRGTALDRRDETTRDWLARVDRLGDQGGYRDEAAPPREDLVSIAEDPTATPDARLAAARLLTRVHGGIPEESKRRLIDDLGPRVRVATEPEVALAADALDELGPAFQAHDPETAAAMGLRDR